MSLIPITYNFEGSIRTDFTGFRQLLRFYTELKDHYHRTVRLDFGQLDYFDANLSAVLCALMHKLGKDNDLTFTVDYGLVYQQFEGVLLRNGCFRPDGQRISDNRKSTILCTQFAIDGHRAFKQYVEQDLFEHRGLAELRERQQNAATRIRTYLCDIFDNYQSHACTDEPFFVCGQYFPQQKRVQFTMTDLGVGFLGPIRDFTNGEIDSDLDAIRWAVTGHSIRQQPDQPNGCGLSGIYEFCQASTSHLQIVTGKSFWGSDLENTIFKGHRGSEQPFLGTTVTILFNDLDRL